MTKPRAPEAPYYLVHRCGPGQAFCSLCRLTRDGCELVWLEHYGPKGGHQAWYVCLNCLDALNFGRHSDSVERISA